ncbi:helix-turn-helix domain-containing protein [Amycolatopsis kentuckyensis]|uniref:helix-turn-helix domain-containing protein n=1 Tax=Amycolatopsis kentuckyensis TaxID=218823 RepID=UPI000A3D1A42|nr:helix-turn-helix domain-containing protein [Amycolatopsis kentuckyensis]
MIEDAANNGGGAGTNGPPTKPTKKLSPHMQWMTVQDVVAEAQKSDETVYAALRRGHLKGSHSSAKAPWRIRRDHFNDWMSRGAPAWRAA